MSNIEDKTFSCYLNDLMLLAKMDDAEYNDIGNKWIEKFLTCDRTRADRLNRNKWANLMLKQLKNLKLHSPVPPPFNCLPPEGPLAQFDSNVSTSSPRSCPDRSSMAVGHSAIGAPVWQSAETMFSENLHVSFPNDVLTSETDTRDICAMIERLGCDVDVFEFVTAVAPELEDQGEGLRKALDSELEHFVKNFVQNSHEMANADIGRLMAQKQCEQREKCINWIQRVCHHTKKNKEWLEKVVPSFDWSKYRANPEEYLKSILIHKVIEVGNVGHEDHIIDWRRQNMLKLLLMRRQEETRMEQVTALRKQLDELQRKIHDIETLMLVGEEMRHEKRAQKLKQLEELMACSDGNKEMIAAMFVALEAGSVCVSV